MCQLQYQLFHCQNFSAFFSIWQALNQTILSLKLASTTTDLIPTLSGRALRSKYPYTRIESICPFSRVNTTKIFNTTPLLFFGLQRLQPCLIMWDTRKNLQAGIQYRIQYTFFPAEKENIEPIYAKFCLWPCEWQESKTCVKWNNIT